MAFNRRTIRIGLVLALCGGLAACGDTMGEQLLYGGAGGFGAAALTGGNVYAGTAIGAAANTLYCQNNPGKC